MGYFLSLIPLFKDSFISVISVSLISFWQLKEIKRRNLELGRRNACILRGPHFCWNNSTGECLSLTPKERIKEIKIPEFQDLNVGSCLEKGNIFRKKEFQVAKTYF